MGAPDLPESWADADQLEPTPPKPRKRTTRPRAEKPAPTEAAIAENSTDGDTPPDLLLGAPADGEGIATVQTMPAGRSRGRGRREPGDDLPQGLGEFETITRTIRFDGDVWHVVTYTSPENGLRTHRMVHRQTKEVDGGTIVNLVPVFDGLLTCIERSIHVAVDPRTRTLGTEVTDESFTLCYQDNRGSRPRISTVTDTELLDTRKQGWRTRLGLSTIVRGKKAEPVRDVVRAVVDDAHDGHVVRIVDRSGPIYVDGKLCYANTTGYVGPDGQPVPGVGTVIGPEGVVDSVRCQTGAETEHYREVQYVGPLPTGSLSGIRKKELQALSALAELLTAYEDRGVTGILVGQLLSAPLTGVPLRGGMSINTVSGIIGDSRSGKTAYDMLLFTTQTRTLYGELPPGITVRCSAPGGSAGATPAGILQWLDRFGGVKALLDDGMKDQWSEQHQRKALDTIYERTTSFVVGGGVPQAQGDQGKVVAAKNKRLYLSATISAECVGPISSMLEDSTYNRMTVVWWDIAKRCDRSTYDRLKAQDHTLLRNDGMRVILQSLLTAPDILSDGYDLALTEFQRAGLDERVAKNYAKTVAGLHVLDLAFGDRGRKTTFLRDALPAAVSIAQKLEAYGTHGGDQVARADVVEATREALTLALETDKSVFLMAPRDPTDVRAGVPVLPQPPENLPHGYDLTHAGWYADGGEWKHKASAVNAGALIVKLPGGRGKPAPFPYRVESRKRDWTGLHDRLNYLSKQRGFRECSRQERLAALEQAGVLHETLRDGSPVIQLDYLWLLGTTYDDLTAQQAADENSEAE